MHKIKKTTIIIDGNNRVYGSEWGKGLYYKGQRTSGILSFLTLIRNYVKKYKRENVIICWDSYSEKRRKICPDYKKGRVRDKLYQEILSQIVILEKMFGMLGIKQCRVDGFEADDLIGDLVNLIDGNKIIVSNDSDMWQLISDETTVDAGKYLMSTELLKQKHGLAPQEYLLMKMIVGDTSDNIKGIEKIGEKTFKKLLNETGSIEMFLAHPKINPHVEIVFRNFELMSLNQINLKEIEDVLSKGIETDFKCFREECFKLRMLSIVKRFEQWISPFKK